jgi:hypothetical protein
MEFFYKGGDCTYSDFRRCSGDTPDYCTCSREKLPPDQWPNKIECTDFGTGPPLPTERGTRSWIKVLGKDEIYFEGVVEVGRSFNASTVNDKVEANTDIFIYEYDELIQGPGALLQQVIFHSSCSDEMYLADTFGGVQLIEFQSQDALISLFNTLEFTFSLSLSLNSDASRLELTTANVVLLSTSFLEPQLASLPVNGMNIPPPLVVEAPFTIIPEENHTAIASIGGILDGRECFGLTQATFSCLKG